MRRSIFKIKQIIIIGSRVCDIPFNRHVNSYSASELHKRVVRRYRLAKANDAISFAEK